jgi:hypothetical protein
MKHLFLTYAVLAVVGKRIQMNRLTSTSVPRRRQAKNRIGSPLPDTKRLFGKKEEIDPVRHLVGAAAA